jgi:lipopolysaccharide export system permease protein
MHILTRHILSEFLKVFLISLLGLTLLMVIVGVTKEALQKGLGAAQVMLLMPYILPDALRFAVPGTTLFAACSVYGRLAAGNEIVAVKSLGISPLVLLWPVMVAACVISFVALWLNDVAVSWGRAGVRRVVIESVEQIAYGMLRTQRSYSSRGFSISVRRVEGDTLVQPMLTFQPRDDQPAVTASAQSGRLQANPERNTLSVVLTDGTIDIGEDLHISFLGDTISREIPLPDASNPRTSETGPSQLPMRDIPTELVAEQERIKMLRARNVADAYFQMATGDFAALTAGAWTHSYEDVKNAEERLCRLRTEPHRRWANGFSCLCFVLVGAPLAIRLRNADFLTSFFLCFLPILIVYYPLLALGVDRAKTGSLPPQSVWLGNVILFACGVWLLRKVRRY